MKRLKVKYIPNIVYNCPCTASKVVDNIIGTVNIFKKQYTDNKASQSLVTDNKAFQLLQIDL